MIKIVITGATGFLATRFINKISSEECQIFAVVRKNSNKIEQLKEKENVEIVELDLANYGELGEKIGTSDILVHFAWNGTRGEERNDIGLQKSNYEYSLSAIKSMLAYGCKKVVISGSQAEYGLHKGVITEETESRPSSEYGKNKYRLFLDAYEICIRRNVELIEPRYFSLYGPEDYDGALIINVIRKMLRNETVDLTECNQVWNYLYVEDAAEALKKLCFGRCESGIYNVASPDSKQLKFYIERIKQMTNSISYLNYGAVGCGPEGPVSIQPCIEKLMNAIQWRPSYSFENGIKETIQWVSSNI